MRTPRPINMTPLRRRVLVMLAAGGSQRGQDIGFEFATNRKDASRQAFRTPQAATRWAAAFMAPLVAAGMVHRAGTGLGGYYSIKQAGLIQLTKGKP